MHQNVANSAWALLKPIESEHLNFGISPINVWPVNLTNRDPSHLMRRCTEIRAINLKHQRIGNAAFNRDASTLSNVSIVFRSLPTISSKV
jgi:hypothetical protein